MDLKGRVLARLAVGLIWLCVIAAGQNQERFTTRLSSVAMDLSMRDTITGSGSVTAVLTGTRLSINGSFAGLSSPATAARLHRGRLTGLRGVAVFDLHADRATSGAITGSFELTADQVASLRKGELYVQLHSEKAPDGNLWGWLLRQEGRTR